MVFRFNQKCNLTFGLISANVGSKAMTPFPQIAGGASAIFGSIQFFIFAASSALAATVHTHNQIPLAILMLIPLIASGILILIFSRTRQRI